MSKERHDQTSESKPVATPSEIARAEPAEQTAQIVMPNTQARPSLVEPSMTIMKGRNDWGESPSESTIIGK